MCYDISFTVEVAQLTDYFPDLVFDEQISLNFEAGIHIMGHAYGHHPVIYASQQNGALHCRLMEWGVIPFYVKEEQKFLRQRASMLNARSERIFEDKQSYWYKIRNRRCLVPMTAFYEHRAVKGFKKKVPYLISVKDQSLFFLPALYSVAELPDLETGEMVQRWTFTIITRSAVGNPVMMNIHNDGENKNRMPLILPFDMATEFVQKDLSEDRYRDILVFQMPAEALTYHTVYTIRSSKERPDGKPKNAYWEWEQLPELGLGNPD